MDRGTLVEFWQRREWRTGLQVGVEGHWQSGERGKPRAWLAGAAGRVEGHWLRCGKGTRLEQDGDSEVRAEGWAWAEWEWGEGKLD